MKLKQTIIGLLTFLILFILGCSKNPAKPEYEKKVAVYGFLWANEPLDQEHAVLVTYSQPLDALYSLRDAGIRDALVTLTEENSGASFDLADENSKPGFYYNESVMIKTNTTYTLTIRVDGQTVTAQTTVPAELHQLTQLDSVGLNAVYRENLGFYKPVIIETENENQLIMVDMYCNESWQNAEYVNAFGNGDHNKPEERDEYDQGINAEPRHIFALVPYKDLTAPEFEGFHVVYWYSSMIVFYGSYTLTISAIDNNYHNYLTAEHPPQSGGIEGGIGVFGSVCGQKYELEVLKED